jgi:hypothetical protein
LIEFLNHNHKKKKKKIFLCGDKILKIQKFIFVLKGKIDYTKSLQIIRHKFYFSRILYDNMEIFFSFFFSSNFKNLNFFFKSLHFFFFFNIFFEKKKKRFEENFRKTFFCKEFIELIFFKNYKVYFTAIYNSCIKKNSYCLSILFKKFLRLIFLKKQKLPNINVFQKKKQTLLSIKLFFTLTKPTNIINLNLKSRIFLRNFFLSYNWFYCKNKFLFKIKKNLFFIFEPIYKNKNGDLIISFLKIILKIINEIVKKNINFFCKSKKMAKIFFLDQKQFIYRKKTIIKNFIKIFEILIKKKSFFMINLNFYQIHPFLTNFFLKKNRTYLIFLEENKLVKSKRKKYNIKKIDSFRLIGKFLESGFYKKKTLVFFFLTILKLFFKKKYFSKKNKGRKKLLEFISFLFSICFENFSFLILFYLYYIKKKKFFVKDISLLNMIFSFNFCYLLKYFKLNNKPKYINNIFLKNEYYFLTNYFLKNDKNVNYLFIKNSWFSFFIRILLENFLTKKKNLEFFRIFFENFFNDILKNFKNFKKFHHRILFNFLTKIKKKHIVFWIKKKKIFFNDQNNIIHLLPQIFKSIYMNQFLKNKNKKIFFFKISNAYLFLFSKILFQKRFSREQIKKNYFYIFYKIFYIIGNLYFFLKKNIFFKIFFYLFKKINLSNYNFFFKIFQALIKNSAKFKNNIKNNFIGERKLIKSLTIYLKDDLDKKKEKFKRKFLKLYLIKNFFLLFTKNLNKTLLKFLFHDLLAFFLNLFFYGLDFVSKIFFKFIKICIKKRNVLDLKILIFFFNIYYYQLLFLFKFYPDKVVEECKKFLKFLSFLTILFPKKFLLKKKKKINLIILIFLKNFKLMKKILQICNFSVLKIVILLKNFSLDLIEPIFYLIYFYLNSSNFSIRKKSIEIISIYFSNLQLDYESFKFGFFFFFQTLILKNFSLKFFFFDIFIKFISNSSNYLICVFSKIIFSSIFFLMFKEKNLYNRYFTIFISKIIFNKISIQNMFTIEKLVKKTKKNNLVFFKLNLFFYIFLFLFLGEYSIFFIKNLFMRLSFFSLKKNFFDYLLDSENFFLLILIYKILFRKIKWMMSLLFIFFFSNKFFFRKRKFLFSNTEMIFYFYFEINMFRVFSNNFCQLFIYKKNFITFFFNVYEKKIWTCFKIFKNLNILIFYTGIDFSALKKNFLNKNFKLNYLSKDRLIKKTFSKTFLFFISLYMYLNICIENSIFFSASFSWMHSIFFIKPHPFFFKDNFKKRKKFCHILILKKIKNIFINLI